MRGAFDDEGLDLLAVAAQCLGHFQRLGDRDILVVVAVDEQNGGVDLRHAQDRRTHRQTFGAAQIIEIVANERIGLTPAC